MSEMYWVHLLVNDENGVNQKRVSQIEMRNQDNTWAVEMEMPRITNPWWKPWRIEYERRGMETTLLALIRPGSPENRFEMPYEKYTTHVGSIVWDAALVSREVINGLLTFLRDSGQWELSSSPADIWWFWSEPERIKQHTTEGGRLVF